jgi:hypothetical protein
LECAVVIRNAQNAKDALNVGQAPFSKLGVLQVEFVNERIHLPDHPIAARMLFYPVDKPAQERVQLGFKTSTFLFGREPRKVYKFRFASQFTKLLDTFTGDGTAHIGCLTEG